VVLPARTCRRAEKISSMVPTLSLSSSARAMACRTNSDLEGKDESRAAFSINRAWADVSLRLRVSVRTGRTRVSPNRDFPPGADPEEKRRPTCAFPVGSHRGSRRGRKGYETGAMPTDHVG
jgi:hypothetical protein